MITGGYDWNSTIDLGSTIDSKFILAETIVDLNSLKAIKITIKKCLMLNQNEKPAEFISDLLPLLQTAKLNCEAVLNANKVPIQDYDKLFKSFYEYLPGKRKEAIFNQDLDQILSKELTKFEQDIYQDRVKQIATGALDPAGQIALTPEDIKARIKIQKSQAIPEINDEDTDSNILNNQGILAYQKGNYESCVDLYMKILLGIEGNSFSYFNYLVLCWEAGIYSDAFVLNEIDRVTLNPYTGRPFTSYFYAMVYEGQNNWQAALTNYQLAYQSASDGIVGEMKMKLDACKELADKSPEQFLCGHLEISDVQDVVISYNGRNAASF